MTIHIPIITTPDTRPIYDMLHYLGGDGTLYEMTLKDTDGNQHTARHQTQWASGTGDYHWYHTKGSEVHAEWEEFYADQDWIYRSVDTSPGNGQYYTLIDDGQWRPPRSRWCPRFWSPGDVYERRPYVDVRRKSDCWAIASQSGYHRTWLRFAEYHNRYEVAPGMLFAGVVELHWLLHNPAEQPDQKYHERYWYARNFGLVQWTGELGYSHATEIHAPGTRPDNKREMIPCLEN